MYVNENLKLWFPLIGVVVLLAFFGVIRWNRLRELKKLGQTHFMKVCQKKHDLRTCQNKVDRFHKYCFKRATSLINTGRSSKYVIDLEVYTACTFDGDRYKTKVEQEIRKKRKRWRQRQRRWKRQRERTEGRNTVQMGP